MEIRCQHDRNRIQYLVFYRTNTSGVLIALYLITEHSDIYYLILISYLLDIVDYCQSRGQSFNHSIISLIQLSFLLL